MENFKFYLEEANNLLQDSTKPIYQLFDGYKSFSCCITNDSPISVYKALRMNSSNFTVRILDGKQVLFHRKKYARKSVEVENVEYKIVGLKRKSTHLSAGVLIANVRFIIS